MTDSDFSTQILQATQRLEASLNSSTLGQAQVIRQLLLCLLASGHALLEGPPGTAKTSTIQQFARLLGHSFRRIQFTADMVPSDITGADEYLPNQQTVEFRQGPIFAQFVLADEINRAPAKVQSAMLEAMEEGQVSAGNNTYLLPDAFMVCATQNPLDRQGTWELPQAQLDRFLMKILVPPPSETTLVTILQQQENPQPLKDLEVFQQVLPQAQKAVRQIHISEAIQKYIARLCFYTHQAPTSATEKIFGYIESGVSARAALSLQKVSKGQAWLSGRDYVTPEDVFQCAIPTMRHRIQLSFEAISEELDHDQVLQSFLKAVPVDPSL